MSTLILMCGIPGSGKTSFATSLINSHVDPDEYIYICPDHIRGKLCGNSGDQSVSKQAWTIAHEQLEKALSLSHDVQVIFDAVLVNPRTRRHLVGIAKKYNANVVYIIMATPLKQAIGRNSTRSRKVLTDVIEDFDARFNNEFPFVKKDRNES